MTVEYEKLVVLMEASIAKFDKDISTLAGTVDTQMRKIETRTSAMSSAVDRQMTQMSQRLLRGAQMFAPLAGQVGLATGAIEILGASAGGPAAAGIAGLSVAIGLLSEKLKQVPELSEEAKKSLEDLKAHVAADPFAAAGRLGGDLAKVLQSQ